MSYRTLVNNAVSLAFRQLRSLAKDVVLHKSANVAFDFSLGELEADPKKSDIVTKAVVLEDDKKSKKHNKTKRHILMHVKGLGDLNAYDTISIPNDVDSSKMDVWRLGPAVNTDGYVVMVEVHREKVDG